MSLFQISLLFHYIGLGVLSTSLMGGWLIHNTYLKAENLQSQAQILRVLKPIGLLGPIGFGIMVLSGIGNLIGFGFQSGGEALSMQWLGEKLFLVIVAAVNGVIFGIRSGKRGKLLMAMVQGNAPADAQAQKLKYDSGSKTFFIIQAILFLGILLRTILK